MRDATRAISAELLKLKRTLALRTAIAAPLAVVLLDSVVFMQRRSIQAGENAFLGFAQINMTMWTILVLPLFIALEATLVAAVEHQGDHWKHLFALPVSRQSILVAKCAGAAILLLVASIVLPAAIALVALVARAIRPELRQAPIPVGLVVIRSLQVFLAAGLMLAIQLWVSLRWRTFVAGLALGIAAVLVLLGGVARSGLGTIVIYVYPWALPPTAMARMAEVHADRALVAAWGAASGILVAALACWHLSRRDSL